MTTTALRFNQGQALLHLAATYPSLLMTILEIVQNALDKDVLANRIMIALNYRTGHLSVRDNGRGTSVERFNKALASVAERNRKGTDSLGQFALGLISPLGKCERFTFVSCPVPEVSGFHEWTFRTADIVKAETDIRIPVRERSDLTLSDSPRRGETKVSWRSEMQLFGIADDVMLSSVTADELMRAILDRYSLVMLENDVNISISITRPDGTMDERPNITASGYDGEPLPVVTIKGEKCGKTVFRLYKARHGRSRAHQGVRMGVEGRPFRFPVHFFARGATDLLDKEVLESLTGGLLEGEIVSESAELVKDRQAFVRNDAYADLCVTIEQWYREHGRAVINELKLSMAENRFQKLGLRSLRVLEKLFQGPKFASLLGVLKTFGRGNIGDGHVAKPGQFQDETAIATIGRHSGDETSESERKRGQSHKEHEGHTPFTAIGPSGKRRKVVRSGSVGLAFMHEPMFGSPDLWKLDKIRGILIFNIRHPLWTECDERGDRAVMRLQEAVAIQALTLELMPEQGRPALRCMLDEFNGSFVPWLLDSDKLRSDAG
jgi:hypothetical protein